MKMNTNVVALIDPADELDALARLCDTEELEDRREWRRREHRRDKRLNLATNIGFVAVLVACAFVIGFCVGAF